MSQQYEPTTETAEQPGDSELRVFGTTVCGIKLAGMVVLAAEGLRCAEHEQDGVSSLVPVEKNVVKIEWITDSVFVVRGGMVSYSQNVIEVVRRKCEEIPPRLFADVVTLLLEEAIKISDTMKDDNDAREKNFVLLVGGKLPHEDSCRLFVIKLRVGNDHQHRYVYTSSERILFADPGIEFFKTGDIIQRLKQARIDFDRAEIAQIAKEFLAYSCTKHDHSKGRATMVTIDQKGYYIFESAYPIQEKNPERGYRKSEVDRFYPKGYEVDEFYSMGYDTLDC